MVNHSNGNTNIKPSGQDGITVNSTGQVGIKNPNPQYTLDVAGNFRTTMDASINSVTVGLGGGNIASNTSLGYQALQVNTNGYNNTALGYQALNKNTTGINNTALGYQALNKNTTGFSNTAVGESALYSNTTGQNNVAIGLQALKQNTTGNFNVATGNDSLFTNTNGSQNVATGDHSLFSNNSGSFNVAAGNNSLFYNTDGSYNTATGYQALYNNNGSLNTALGYIAGSSISTGTNNTCIGTNSQPSSATASNEFILGSGVGVIRCAVGTITTTSDARDKKDIEILDAGLQFVDKLKPVKFVWNMRDGGKVDIPAMGFIAQDLQQVQKDTGIVIPNLVYESNPERLEASYGTLLPVLVKAVQELSEKVTSLETELNELKNK